MRTIYWGIEDAVPDATGPELASALVEVVGRHDPFLAAGLLLDPEASGVGVGAASDDDLRRVFQIAVDARLARPGFLDELLEDEIDDLLPFDDDASEPTEVAWPMSAGGVTKNGVLGRISTRSYRPEERPASDETELAAVVAGRLGSESWASGVKVAVDGRHVVIEAPDERILERVADLVGVEFDELLRAESSRLRGSRSPSTPTSNWLVQQEPWSAGEWVATGPIAETRFSEDLADRLATTKALVSYLDGRHRDRRAPVDVRVRKDGRVSIVAEERGAVEWALRELGIDLRER